jgi:peptidoglycan/LPS O-acetylase OafA/YrhL
MSQGRINRNQWLTGRRTGLVIFGGVPSLAALVDRFPKDVFGHTLAGLKTAPNPFQSGPVVAHWGAPQATKNNQVRAFDDHLSQRRFRVPASQAGPGCRTRKGKTMKSRLIELDSLRGFAAVSVVVLHYLQFFGWDSSNNIVAYLLRETPLHIFSAGNEAVIFFFVLSGFVLSLPFFGGKQPYGQFIIKRVCRIYLPFWCALIVAILLRTAFAKGSVPSLGWALNTIWVSNVNLSEVLRHFSLLADFNVALFNGAFWSLVHEMRISLIFPLIMLLVVKFDWKVNVGMAVLLSAISYLLISIFKPASIVMPSALDATNILWTIHYVAMFIVGALLAKHRAKLVESVSRLNVVFKGLILIAGVFLYTFKYWIVPLCYRMDYYRFFGMTVERLPYPFLTSLLKNFVVNDWITLAGCAIFIVSALASVALSRVLTNKLIHFLGQASYSIYLFHVPVLLATIYLLYRHAPVWVIVCTALIATAITSTLSYLLVERYSVKMGKTLASKIGA